MRRVLCLLLMCALLGSALSGCGAPAGSGSPAPSAAPGIAYADAYLQYLAVYGALTGEVERRVEAHNAVLRVQYPDSYYMNSSYLLQSCIPFLPAYPALGSGLRGDSLEAAESALHTRFADAKLSVTAPGVYEAVYTYLDKTSGAEVERAGRCIWECDGGTGALRVRAWLDDEMTEFTEFIPQGDNTWLLYTMADKALITYEGGTVTAITHAHMINDAPLGTFGGDVRFLSLADRDFYPNGSAPAEWIRDDENAEYVLTLSDGEMVFSGRVSADLLDAGGNKIGVSWTNIDPIRFLK